jgi:hypothetical protein
MTLSSNLVTKSRWQYVLYNIGLILLILLGMFGHPWAYRTYGLLMFLSCIGLCIILFFGKTKDNKILQSKMNQTISHGVSFGVDMFQVFLLGFGWHWFLALLVLASQWFEVDIRDADWEDEGD